VVDEGGSDAMDSIQLEIQGLHLAKEVAVLPLQQEFMSWPEEARDDIVEATALILAISLALLASNQQNNTDVAMTDLAVHVEKSAAESLEQCTLVDHGGNASDMNEHLTKWHETIVPILRGLQ
jgi:hypothetical protein